jgi:hypothetical protein
MQAKTINDSSICYGEKGELLYKGAPFFIEQKKASQS